MKFSKKMVLIPEDEYKQLTDPKSETVNEPVPKAGQEADTETKLPQATSQNKESITPLANTEIQPSNRGETEKKQPNPNHESGRVSKDTSQSIKVRAGGKLTGPRGTWKPMGPPGIRQTGKGLPSGWLDF